MSVQTSRPARPASCRSSRSFAAIILLAAGWHPVAAAAGNDDLVAPTFSFNGFGTVGVVHSTDTQADFVSNPAQPKGAGFTSPWSATPDTKLGMQFNLAPTDRLSAVAQIMSQYQYDGTFRPDLEWFNVKYLLTPDLSIRVGRIAIPTFMISDSLNIGYALPFARIPAEVYAQLPITHSDGIDGSYRIHVGAVANTVQVFLGGFKSKLPNQGTYDTQNLYGIADTIDYGATTLHFSYQTLRYNLSFDGLELRKDPQQVATVGAGYDPGKWFVSAELIRAPDDAFGLFYSWYANGGYRFDQVTPYLGYARATMNRVGSLGLPPFIDQDTATLGLRWDLRKNIDFKAQLDRVARHGGFNQFLVNQQPGFQQRGTDELLTVLIDFVF
jgi:hypothetical protein